MTPAELVGFLLAGGLALTVTPVVIVGARWGGALDYPGAHKVHAEPVPTLGGLALVTAVLGALWVLEAAELGIALQDAVALTLAALPVVAVGVWDDLRACSIPTKLAAHFLAGAILYAFGLGVVELTNPFGPTLRLGPLGFVVTLLWVAAVINSLNLMDGLDGLAPGIGGIAALALAAVGALYGEGDLVVVGLVLAGALAGFYPYNFPRARIFLGDVGSTFVGLMLATAALLENRKATAAVTLLVPMVALGLPVLDTVFAVARRMARGRNPLRRDTDHLHHRLLRVGLSPQQAVGCLLGVSALLGAVAVILALLPKQAVLSVTVLLGGAGLAAVAALAHVERRARGAKDR